MVSSRSVNGSLREACWALRILLARHVVCLATPAGPVRELSAPSSGGGLIHAPNPVAGQLRHLLPPAVQIRICLSRTVAAVTYSGVKVAVTRSANSQFLWVELLETFFEYEIVTLRKLFLRTRPRSNSCTWGIRCCFCIRAPRRRPGPKLLPEGRPSRTSDAWFLL